jgi:hypothetical protein
MSSKLPIAFIAAAAFLAAPAIAQTVYRCGDSYVQQPCPGGKAVDVDDARSKNQRTDALEATQRTSQAANAMEKVRLAEEAKPAQVLLPPAKAEAATKEDDAKVLRAPAAKKARAKAKPASHDGGKHAKKKKS